MVDLLLMLGIGYYCLGLGMLGGGLAAVIIAATRVVLHYDEEFVGLTRDQLLSVNPRLLSFMAHDRVTLAGTMCALGLSYATLAWFGVRRGRDWARRTILYSAFTGFSGFFLFLGFGYLDPFHAFVTVVLLQLLLMSMPARLVEPAPRKVPPEHEDWRWRWLQWGQLILILHAVAISAAGVAISTIGCTTVLIPEDLHYLNTTHASLNEAGPKIIPLIAHDRATFGAMLLSCAWVFLLPFLWGVAYGERWLWWMTLLAGMCGYLPALTVHFLVGYTDFVHLLPAYGGFTMLLIGLGFCFPYYSSLCEPQLTRLTPANSTIVKNIT